MVAETAAETAVEVMAVVAMVVGETVVEAIAVAAMAVEVMRGR